MLRVLIRKEITETILDLRFMATALLCVVLIPLGMLVNLQDYEQRLAATQQEHQMYRQRYSVPVAPAWGKEEAQGFRPPSVMSLFASGLDPFLPDRVFTSPTGLFRTERHPRLDSAQTLLFGQMDFAFNVTFILSLAALIVSFSAVCGEKERGTLRLMIAHTVPRGKIILAKVVGKYVLVVVPFLVSMLIALLILEMSPNVSIGSHDVWPAFLVILGVTLLFILCMVSLGLCISTFTARAMSSMIWLFFIWVVLVLGIPKVSPIIAEILYPVESENAFSFAKRMAAEDIREEFNQRSKDIEKKYSDQMDKEWNPKFIQIAKKYRNPSSSEYSEEDYLAANKKLNDEWNKANRERYDKLHAVMLPLAEELKRHTAQSLGRLEQDHRNRRKKQVALGLNLSRLSPVSSYAFILAELAGTGVTEMDNLSQNAQRFQEQVKDIYYDQAYNQFNSGQYRPKAYNPFDPPTLPDMTYTRVSLAPVVQTVWPDILLLILFSGACLTLAIAGFNRYDVR
ncbi:MAG: ABC transporter permease [Phycisphaerae bacterium]|nr:ABC transporter permease [Phycisphaerae bacterium]